MFVKIPNKTITTSKKDAGLPTVGKLYRLTNQGRRLKIGLRINKGKAIAEDIVLLVDIGAFIQKGHGLASYWMMPLKFVCGDTVINKEVPQNIFFKWFEDRTIKAIFKINFTCSSVVK